MINSSDLGGRGTVTKMGTRMRPKIYPKAQWPAHSQTTQEKQRKEKENIEVFLELVPGIISTALDLCCAGKRVKAEIENN